LNKKAFYALILALFVPMICYFIVKKYSDSAVVMPRHYLPDTVLTHTHKGKQVYDTVWHKISDFTLTNQLGKQVSLSQLKGKIIVADFFFTHCPTICPGLTRNMKQLQDSISNARRVGTKTPDFFHLLSFSIDPERDSVQRLKQWADRFQVNPDQWWLLTGEKKKIYDMVIEEMKVGLVDGHGVDTSFIHSDLFVLIDTNRHVRGYYHGLEEESIAKLSNDIILLTMEKDPNKKSFLSGQLPVIAVALLLTFIGVGLLLMFLRKKA
jgi:protein SCO1/2